MEQLIARKKGEILSFKRMNIKLVYTFISHFLFDIYFRGNQMLAPSHMRSKETSYKRLSESTHTKRENKKLFLNNFR